MIEVIHHVFNWFEHGSGMTNLSGPEYGFWSGFGSDITELALIITLITGSVKVYQNTRCHVDTCHKHGKYPFQHYKLCKNHHPNVPDKLTHLHIMKLHKEANK